MRKRAKNILSKAGYYRNWQPDNGEPPVLIAALADYAVQRPGLEPADYGYDASDCGRYSSPDWRQYYMQDSRMCTDQFQDVKKALRECFLTDVTDQNILDAAPQAFSGRLEVEKIDNSFKLHYCAGQNAPTEYRAAIAAVLSYAAILAHRESS